MQHSSVERGERDPTHLFGESVWTDAAVKAAGIPVTEVPFVTLGGGLGSFAAVEYLRVSGVPTSNITIVSAVDLPHHTYRRLARNSQITDDDEVRSPSDVTIDNIWGWPGYAVREAIQDKTIRPLWRVFTEPVISEYFNPKARHIYESVERECDRIRWNEMLVKGQARFVRRRYGGGFFVVVAPEDLSSHDIVAYHCTYVHIAVGYPSLRFLPDLQAYRARYHDQYHVVNAYEPHEHVYEELIAKPGTVLLRGAGIVASRVLQRLLDDREKRGAQTQIVHLFRHYYHGSQGRFGRGRSARYGFVHQPFVYPKAAMGGQLKAALARLPEWKRVDFIKRVGGTTTPKRSLWERQLARGRAGGWYRTLTGEVADVAPTDDDQVMTRVRIGKDAHEVVTARYVIDATGLEGDVKEHSLLADILQHTGATSNPMGRLDVERTFEVRGTRNTPGRMYASGSITLGGFYAPVDSFIGVQYAASQMCGDMAQLGFCKTIGPMRSIHQWFRWVRNKQP